MTKNQTDIWDMIAQLPTLEEEKQLKDLLEEYPDLAYDDVEVEVKAAVGMFDLLEAADRRNFAWYSKLSPALKTAFPKETFIGMTWMSSIEGASVEDQAFKLKMVNNLLNVNHTIYKDHPELYWKLIAACGSGFKQRHKWVARSKKDKISKVTKFMLQWYPGANDQELAIITGKMTRDDFHQFAKTSGIDDKQLKEVLDAFDEERGIKPKKASRKKA